MTVTEPAPASHASILRSVALPKEHGGWGLTLEPGVLGLLIAPGVAGVCLAAAAVVAFAARTPVKIVLVDRHRERWLERTSTAARVAIAELTVLAALLGTAIAFADGRFWMPAVVAAPLFFVELWFEMRSRGRRLIPELAGAVGVCSVAAMILLADDRSAGLAAGVWLLLAGRAVTSIPHVRMLVARLHARPDHAAATVMSDVVAVAVAGTAAVLDRSLVAGAVAIAMVVAIQRVTARHTLPRATVLGIRQTAMGLGVVLVTALGVLVWGAR